MIEILNSKQIPLSKLTANNGQIEGIPKNPRFIKNERYQKLVKSIQNNPEFLGARELIVHEYNGKFVVLCGNMRYRAAKELGFDTLPAKVIPDDYTTEQIKAIIIKDNISFGDDDFDALANEWDALELEEWGLEFPDLGEDFEPEILEAQEDDYEMPEQMQIDVVLGDLIEIGEHRLLCGDSTDSDQVAKLMNGEKADMVFTDPPYGVSYQSNMRTKTEKFDVLENDNVFITEWIYNLPLFSKGFVFVWTSWKVLKQWIEFCEPIGELSNIIVWDKGGGGIGDLKKTFLTDFEVALVYHRGAEIKGKRLGSVWSIGKDASTKYLHPTQKPVELPAMAIENITNQNELVLDLFLGSGSTLVASHQLKRKCYGMELDPKYCQVIIERMQKLDPTLKVKINGILYNKQTK
jgi:DNA modification methylase